MQFYNRVLVVSDKLSYGSVNGISETGGNHDIVDFPDMIGLLTVVAGDEGVNHVELLHCKARDIICASSHTWS